MADSPLLALGLLEANQKQEEVTVNAALRRLDGIVNLSVIDRDLATPPVNPSEGDRYLVAASGTGAWSGWDGDVALYSGASWRRLTPRDGWQCWVEDEGVLLLRQGGAWTSLLRAETTPLARAPFGSGIDAATREEELTGLSGATVDTTITFPNRAIILAASVLTTTTITGATSFDCGIAGEPGKFGATLGVTAGAMNVGSIGPTAVYADTAVRLTANGGNFTGGAVRVALQYLMPRAPTT